MKESAPAPRTPSPACPHPLHRRSSTASHPAPKARYYHPDCLLEEEEEEEEDDEEDEEEDEEEEDEDEGEEEEEEKEEEEEEKEEEGVIVCVCMCACMRVAYLCVCVNLLIHFFLLEQAEKKKTEKGETEIH